MPAEDRLTSEQCEIRTDVMSVTHDAVFVEDKKGITMQPNGEYGGNGEKRVYDV